MLLALITFRTFFSGVTCCVPQHDWFQKIPKRVRRQTGRVGFHRPVPVPFLAGCVGGAGGTTLASYIISALVLNNLYYGVTMQPHLRSYVTHPQNMAEG